jgi:isocitrate/isopropylmalate dehydrogenase
MWGGTCACVCARLDTHAAALTSAVTAVVADGRVLTRDVGGKASTSDVTLAVIAALPGA